MFGSVERCAEQVARLKATGIDALTIWVPVSHPDREFANRSLRLFCEEVIPRVELLKRRR